MASLNDLYAHLKTLCEQWFYNKSTSDDRFATKSHGHGNVTNDGKIGSTANKPVITGTGGVVTTGSFGTSANTFCQGNDSRLSDARTPKSHTHGNISNDGKVTTANNSPSKLVVTDNNGVVAVATQNTAGLIKDSNSNQYTNIGSLSANASQQQINQAINTKIASLTNIDLIKIVDSLPIASNLTMNQFYLVRDDIDTVNDGDNSFYKIYVTVQQDDTNFYWELVDDANIKGFLTEAVADTKYATSKGYTANQNIVSNASGGLTTEAKNNHAHGNLLSGGTITATGNFKDYLAIVDNNNKLTKATAIDVLDNIVQQLITYGAS